MKQSSATNGRYEVIYPRGEYGRRHLPRVVGRPAEVLYKVVSEGMRARRLRGSRKRTGDLIVVSVGNLEVGGNGKTPFAMYLVEQLRRRGCRPVYISRGFSSVAERLRRVTVRVPDSGGPPPFLPGIRYVRHDGPDLSREIGDEGAMVVARCPDIPTLFARDRLRAIDVAQRLFAPTHIVLDDAFQSWAVPRDVDIVLLDSVAPFGNGHLVPAGSLREGIDALRRAHVVGVNDVDDVAQLDVCGDDLRARLQATIPLFGLRRDLTLVDAVTGRSVPSPMAGVVLVTSVARPQRIEQMIEQRGLHLVRSLRYPDHHRYDSDDIATIRKALGGREIGSLVTTDKDWAKLREFSDRPAGMIARLALHVVGFDIVGHIEKPQAHGPAASR